jgi:hypothetical protein
MFGLDVKQSLCFAATRYLFLHAMGVQIQKYENNKKIKSNSENKFCKNIILIYINPT